MKAATTAAADYVRQRTYMYVYARALINVQIPAAAARPVEGGTEPVSIVHMYMCESNVYVHRGGALDT